MEKYITVKISGIIIQVAKATEVKGYTEGILEVFFPDPPLKNPGKWIKENNTRMEAICKFLNDNNL